MSTVNGLPAHALLVHAVVVLVPLTAIGVILCALWPSFRRRLIWPTAAFAVLAVALTPLTTEAGEWLEKRVPRSSAVHTHTELGDTLIYFVVPLLIAAALVTIVHMRETRGTRVGRTVAVVVATVAVVSGIAATAQIYRIGESGTRAVWCEKLPCPATSTGR